MNFIQSALLAPGFSGKRFKSAIGGFLVILFLAQGAALYSRLTSTSAVDQADVLAEYRARQEQIDRPAAAASSPQEPGAQLVPEQVQPTAAAAGQAPASAGGGAGAPPPACDWVCPTVFEAPEAGVYSYFQCYRTAGQCTGADEPEGWEEIGGVKRTFNRQGSRYVTVAASKTQWNNVHFYADEHKEEFDLSIDPSGVYDSRYKVEIKFGGIPGGVDIRQDPPFKITSFPLEVGRKWSGSWKDLNGQADADYTSEVVGKEELKVGGKTYRTWVIQHHLRFKGPENHGTTDLKFWLSPELRQPVQESYDQELETPQGPYRAAWMVTLADPKPTR